MSCTYEIVPSASGQYWRILSNGKPLRFYYVHRSYAEDVVEQLKEKAAARAELAEWRQKHGITPAPRDSLRSKAYAAERRAGLRGGPVLTKTAKELSQLCVFLAFQAGFEKALVPEITFSRRKRGAHAWMHHITLGSARDLGTLVHEYAHVVTWDEQPAHGPRWAAAYVALARVAFGDLGPQLADRLASEFRAIGLLQESAA